MSVDQTEYLASLREDSETESEDSLELIRREGKELIRLQQEIADHKLQLEQLGDQLKELSERTLPELMRTAGIDHIGIDNINLVMKEAIYGSIPKEDLAARREIMNWLVDNGHGGMISRTATVVLPKGDKTMELKLLKAVEALNLPIEVTEAVHVGTYKAWCRREIEAEREAESNMKAIKPIPRDTLGIRAIFEVKIDDSKPRKRGR